MLDVLNAIGGTAAAARSGAWLDNIEPATGTVYSRLPDSDSSDVALAVAAAESAYAAWSRTSLDERARVLGRLADLIDAEAEELARAETVDSGKPIALARSVEMPRAAANFRFFSRAITQWASESHSMGAAALNYTLRTPLGVVGCISPWNLPLYLFTWKIAPALAVGNTVVAKPSELTPATAFWLGGLADRAGFPPGVLNIVHGLGPKVGRAIVDHPRVRAISFTGGTKTGADIASRAAPRMKKLSLELGGKNPTLVFADADFDKSVSEVVRAAFSNQGQICLCGSRILVERSIYAAFRDALIARVRGLLVGDPLLETTDQGALVSEAHRQKVLSYVALAKQEGGRLLLGGEKASVPGRCANGFFVAPTVFESLGPECRTNQEEIFGPVATMAPFDTEDEALVLANSTEYGLAASVFTQNLTRAHRVAERLEAGIVWVNTWLLRDLRTPFGGVKQSGVGREGGFEALRFFTDAKNVCIKLE